MIHSNDPPVPGVPANDLSVSVQSAILLAGDNQAYRSRNRFIGFVVFHILILVFALCEIFDGSSSYIYALGLFFSTIGSMILLTLSRHAHYSYRRLRINLLLSNSYALSLTDIDNSEILGTHSPLKIPSVAQGLNLSAYYTSQLPPGPKRLKSNLAETLYFASYLYEASATSLAKVLLAPASLVLLMILLAPILGKESLIAVDRVLILVIVFVNEIHLITEWYELFSASRECRKFLEQLLSIRADDTLNLHHLFCRYSALTLSVPGPYISAYLKQRHQLTEAWSKQRSNYEQ